MGFCHQSPKRSKNMVAEFSHSSYDSNTSSPSSDITKKLVIYLLNLPGDWALTPLIGKRPYRKNWQSEPPIIRNRLAELIENGDSEDKDKKVHPKGYGLRTGEVSEGILAIDADGYAAHEKLEELGGLPKTVAFTSGKPGRCQYLVRVPKEFWSVIRTQKINTKVKDQDGKEQLLEVRWNGCQSVLPPSVHPETGFYKWVNSPQDCEVAQCPLWIIEYFLNQSTPATPKATNQPVIIPSGDVPLYQCLSISDRNLIDNGVGEGSRDDSGAQLTRNLIGTANKLEYLGHHFSGDARQLFDDYCSKCSPPISDKDADRIWKSAEKSNPTPTLTDDALENCVKAWQHNQSKQKQAPVQNGFSVQKSTVSADTSQLSAPLLTDRNITHEYFEEIVSAVSTLLDSPENQNFKGVKLDQLKNRLLKEGIPKESFDSILATERSKREILPEDTQQLKHLVSLGETSVNWYRVLPLALARDLIHDAELLCVDPIVLFNSLLAAVASLGGTKTPLNVQTHEIKCNIWAITVLESGGGKSRADNVIFAPLRELQANEDENFKRLRKDYQKDSSGTPPKLRKYIFEVSTIQAVLRRLSESPGHSSVWARDEIAGLFNSLGQHSKGKDSEDQQILLKLWDGGGFNVDRVSLDDSYSCQASALSISGGIQPGIFRKTFSDPEDSNGLQSRPLYAVPKRLKLQRKKGFIHLSERLPLLYDYVNKLPKTVVKISESADIFYSKIVDDNEDLLETINTASLRTWMFKYPTQVLKIALILHLIECFYSPKKDVNILTAETLQRALHLGEYYKASFQFLQEKVSNSDDVSTILLQVLDRAKQSPSGVTARDIYRPLRSIQSKAKSLGLDPGIYVEGLFNQLVDSGYGQVVRSGKAVKFTANHFPPTITPADSADRTDKVDSNLDIPSLPAVSAPADDSIPVSADTSKLHLEHGEIQTQNILDEDVDRLRNCKTNQEYQVICASMDGDHLDSVLTFLGIGDHEALKKLPDQPVSISVE